MICCRCGRAASKLIVIFDNSWESFEDSKFTPDGAQHEKQLCCICLVGKSVPAFRPTVDNWQVGEIESYDDKTGKHTLIFGANDSEEVEVSTVPFADYLSSCRVDAPPGDAFEVAAASTHSVDGSFCFSFEHPMETFSMTEALKDLENIEELEFSPDEDCLPVLHGDVDALLTNSDTNVTNQQWADTPPLTHGGFVKHEAFSTPQASTPMLPLHSPQPVPTTIQVNDAEVTRKTWKVEEDQQLRACIEASESYHGVVKWPEIAKRITGRSGKQCRERYLNHLKPVIKQSRWSPQEDARIFHLYNAIGSKWAVIAKLLSGRTDNSVKNRYHHLRRKLEKQISSLEESAMEDECWMSMHWAKDLLGRLQWAKQRSAEAYSSGADGNDRSALVNILVDNILAMHNYNCPLIGLWHYEYEVPFGPFFTPHVGAMCSRCNLGVPSAQTGRLVCSKTGWCQACTTVPPYVMGESLCKLHIAQIYIRFAPGF